MRAARQMNLDTAPESEIGVKISGTRLTGPIRSETAVAWVRAARLAMHVGGVLLVLAIVLGAALVTERLADAEHAPRTHQ